MIISIDMEKALDKVQHPFMIDIEREREAETQAEGEAGSMPGA